MQEFKTWVSDAREIFPLSLLPPDPPFFFRTLLAKVPVASLLDDSRMINSRFVHVTGEDPMLSDQQQYRYMTVDDMKSMGDDSMRVNVTDDERDNRHSGGKSMKDCVSKFSSFLSISLSRSDWISDRSWALRFFFDRQFSIFSLTLFSIHCKVQRGITKGCSRRWRINWILASVEIFLRVVVARVRL